MIGMMKWILIAIFTFTTFGADEKNKSFCCSRGLKKNKVEFLHMIAKWTCWNCISLNKSSLQKCEMCKQPKFIWVKNTNNVMKIYKIWKKGLSNAAAEGDEERVQLLLNAFPKEENEKMIEYVMQENNEKYTALHFASYKGYEKVVTLLLNVFGKDKNTKVIEYVMKEDQNKNTALHFASLNGHQEIVTLLLNAFGKASLNGHWKIGKSQLKPFSEEEKDKLIEYVMKENDQKYTALHFSAAKGYQEIVKLLFKPFISEEENEKLIEYVMKENIEKFTALHLTSLKGHKEIVKLLLTAFSEREKDKLIEYVMKESTKKITALHFSSYSGHEKIVILLLNVFGKDNNKQLIKYLMKEDEDKYTASHLASAQENHKIVKLLFQKQNNAIILRDLQKVIQIFNKQNEDQKENSPLWYLFEDNRCGLGKEIILNFLITDYNRHIHFI